MNEDIVKGHWKEIKGKLKQQWGKFTDDDLKTMEGNYEELEGLLQKQYGYGKEDAHREIKKFLSDNGWNR